MKKISIIFFLGFYIPIVQSCKKPPLPVIVENQNSSDTLGNSGGNSGNNGEDVEVSPFLGDWDYTKIDLTNGTLSFMAQEAGTFTGKGIDINGSVSFSENPNRYTTDLDFTADVAIVAGGQQQNQEIPVDRVQTQGTWTEDNGRISLVDDDGTKIQVVSNTNTQIVFSGNFTEKVEINQFITLDANSDVIFTIEK
jgi:hypothetical protein|tara:strand:- start:6152 stop:6736 length:585 start_codon:yes stop_codon:yes gene_type:complete